MTGREAGERRSRFLIFTFGTLLLLWGTAASTSYFMLDKYLESGYFNKKIVERMALNQDYSYTLETKSALNWNPFSFGINFSRFEFFDSSKQVVHLEARDVRLRLNIHKMLFGNMTPSEVTAKDVFVVIDNEKLKPRTADAVSKKENKKTLLALKSFDRIHLENVSIASVSHDRSHKSHFSAVSLRKKFGIQKLLAIYDNENGINSAEVRAQLQIKPREINFLDMRVKGDMNLSTNKLEKSPKIIASGRGWAKIDLGKTGFSLKSLDYKLYNVSGSLKNDGDDVSLSRISVDGRYLLQEQKFVTDQIWGKIGETDFSSSGEVGFLGKGRHLKFSSSFDKIAVSDLVKAWPNNLMPESRKWILDSVKGGSLSNLEAEFDLTFGEKGVVDREKSSLKVSASIENGILEIPENKIPRIESINGNLEASLDNLKVNVHSARIGETKIENAHVELNDGKNLRIKTKGRGKIPSLINLYDAKYAVPLFGYNIISGITGDASVEMDLALKIGEKVPHIKKHINAVSSNVGATLTSGGLGFEDGKVDLLIDDDFVDIALDGNLGGHSAVGNLHFGLADHSSCHEFSGILPYKFVRPIFGKVIDPIISINGNIGLELKARALKGGMSYDIDLDLTDTNQSAPYAKLKKVRGEPSRLTMAFEDFGSDKSAIKELKLVTKIGTVDAKKIDISPARTRISDMRINDNVVRELVIDENKSEQKIRAEIDYVNYADFDWLEFGAEDGDAKKNGRAGTSVIEAHISELIFPKNEIITGMNLKIACNRETCDEVHLSREPLSERDFAFDLLMEHEKIRLESNDAGLLLRAFEISDNIVGGQLTIDTFIRKYSDKSFLWQNNVRIKKFQVVNAPILARILSFASLTGILNILGGKGLKFHDLAADFILCDRKLIFAQSAAEGEAVGLGFSGKIDLLAKTLDLEGKVMPFNVVNIAVRHLPLAGKYISGQRGEGLFTIDFHLTGPLDDPSVKVNPITTAMPYALKRYFKESGRLRLSEPVEVG